MENRGKVVEDKIHASGKSKSFISDRLNITRQTLRNWLDTPNLDFDKILKIGKLIGHDFTGDFPDLRKSFPLSEEPEAKYQGKSEMLITENYITCQDLIEAKNQLIAAKDEQIRMLKDFADQQTKTLQEFMAMQQNYLALQKHT
ncbi:MAG: hypothetical protein EOP53_13170 [Sphingobacteriales bacterium]|nr:MAG: hypothetical protein EOP53_13170 [Sphingobacteriales bacterium]